MPLKHQIYLLGALERFAFNGLRAMLVLMLIKSFHMQENAAFQFYGVTLMLSFLVPILGGLLIQAGERDLGVMKVGTVYFTLGFILLAIAIEFFLWPGIALIVAGTGLVRASVPALLGKILEKTPDENADSSFSVLYVFYNIGSFAGSLLFASAGEIWGWEVSFIVGSFSSLAILLLLHKIDLGLYTQANWGSGKSWMACFLCTLFILAVGRLPNEVLDFMAVFVVLIVPIIMVRPLFKNGEGEKGLLLFSLLPAMVLFYALYEQASLSLTTFTEGYVDRKWGSLNLPTTLFWSIDPFYNIVLGVVLAMTWRSKSLSGDFKISFLKILCGIVCTFMAFSFLSHQTAQAAGPISPWVLLVFYFLLVAAELLIVPVLLSLVNSTFGSARASFNMSLVFSLMGASMWIAQYLTRNADLNLDLLAYHSLFQEFQWWAAVAFAFPAVAGLLAVIYRVIYKKKVMIQGP